MASSSSLFRNGFINLHARFSSKGLCELSTTAIRTPSTSQRTKLARPNPSHVKMLEKWLKEYFSRGPMMKTTLPPLDLDAGTDFERKVWKALLEIPFGKSSYYGAIAARIGKPKASRAVGRAIGNNPIFILVPCHRVIGKDQSLTGYAGGLSLKKKLLQHEKIAFKSN